MRERIKRIAFLLDWPEGQFVNASVAVVLEMIDRPITTETPKTVFLARQALEFAKSSPAMEQGANCSLESVNMRPA